MARLHGLAPEQLSQIGIFYIEKAILDVLLEAYNEKPLNAKEIARRAGLPAPRDNHSMAIPILLKLENEGIVENISENKRHKWQMTERGYKER